MSVIRKRKVGDDFTFNVRIRKKDIFICRTFKTEEDAKIFSFYKERLIGNMINFNVDLKDRITLEQLYELRLHENNVDEKTLCHYSISLRRLISFFGENKFLSKICLEDWINACNEIYKIKVYRGCVKEKNERPMSLPTLKKVFAYASSCISYAQSKGLELQNHPLTVIQSVINPMMK